jgi:hypothetical protein
VNALGGFGQPDEEVVLAVELASSPGVRFNVLVLVCPPSPPVMKYKDPPLLKAPEKYRAPPAMSTTTTMAGMT